MKTLFPQAKNPLTSLQELVTAAYTFKQILDFGRYTVRVDPDSGRGWFKSEIGQGIFAGTLHFDGAQLISASDDLPPQVASTLRRAGYTIDTVR